MPPISCRRCRAFAAAPPAPARLQFLGIRGGSSLVTPVLQRMPATADPTSAAGGMRIMEARLSVSRVGQNGLRALRGAEWQHGQRHRRTSPDEGLDVVRRVLDHRRQRPDGNRDLQHQLVHAHHRAALGTGVEIRDPAFRPT